jgi:hypothetical protein
VSAEILRIQTLSFLDLAGLEGGRPGSVELIKHEPDHDYVELCVIESETKEAKTVLLDRDGLVQLEMAVQRVQQGMR